MNKLFGATYGARICYDANNEGAGGGGGEGGKGTTTQQQQSTKKPDEQNNADGFDIDVDNIWKDPEDKTKNNGNQQQQQQQQQQPDISSAFDTHVGKLDFGFKISPEAIQAMQNGDPSKFAEEHLTALRQVYKHSIQDAAKMVSNMRDQAVAEAVEKSKGILNTTRAFDTLNSIVPAAKNPNVAPIAQAAFNQFIKQGLGEAEAAKKVGRFFNSIANIKPTEFGMDNVPPRGSGNNRGNRGSVAADDGEDTMDWVAFASQPT